MDLTEVIRSRRSIRKFEPQKISQATIRNLLELASCSPSAHNTQPWHSIVIENFKMKAKLAKEMGKVWISDLVKDGTDKIQAEKTVETKNWNRITNSPILIIICLNKKGIHKHADSRRRKVEYLIAVQSVAAYIQTLLLAAHSQGLGACWTCTPLFCQNRIRRTLKLPKELEPQAMIIMGLPNEKPPAPSRKPLHETCTFNS